MGDEIEPRRAGEPHRFEAQFAAVDRSPVLATGLVAALVCLAILKPWATDGTPPTGARPPSPSPAGVAVGERHQTATPVPTATGEAVIGLCLDPGSWRSATIETWRDQTVHVWRAIDPASASGPLDPTIPIVPAVGNAIPAIGYCAPTSGPNQPFGPASIRAWRRDDGAAHAIDLRQVAPVSITSPYGALFGPPGALGSTGSWPNGVVVFRYDELSTDTERWFAIEVSGTGEDNSPVASPQTPPRLLLL